MHIYIIIQCNYILYAVQLVWLLCPLRFFFFIIASVQLGMGYCLLCIVVECYYSGLGL